MQISIAPELQGRVILGLFRLDGVTVAAASEALNAEVDALCASLRESRYGAGKSSEVPGADDARTLYKALGLDPTKIRPSNEALLRRALKGETLYRINTLVDALNLSSLRDQLPFGLYDLDRVHPRSSFGRAAPGEAYEGIRKGSVNVEGRPVLVDAQGPFGNPTSDSARTMITPNAPRSRVACVPRLRPRASTVLDPPRPPSRRLEGESRTAACPRAPGPPSCARHASRPPGAPGALKIRREHGPPTLVPTAEARILEGLSPARRRPCCTAKGPCSSSPARAPERPRSSHGASPT